MTWFARFRRSRFPADTMQRLELYGRYEYDRYSSGIDNSDMWSDCIQPFYDDARADPEGFSAALLALITGERGGFATFGASRLIFELMSDKYLDHPGAVRIMDAGIDFKLARGLTLDHFTGFERDRLEQRVNQGEQGLSYRR